MPYLKSHFWYNKNQRNGILFLILIVIILQVIYVFIDFSSDKSTDVNNKELLALQLKIDSLKSLEIEKRKPKIYPFNPNYITDYRGSQLGMSIEEIDRLHSFRKTKKFVNSAREFQRVTKISDSLLLKISPYFKFPDWVMIQNKKQNSKYNPVISDDKKNNYDKSFSVSTTDLNFATIQDLKSVNGVGESLSERIVKYRKRLQGFSFRSQIYEVWKLDKETADRVLSKFNTISKPEIKKININTASFKQVLSNPYIDYDLCKKIFEYRDEVAELQSIEKLKNIVGFPLEKYDRIILYLQAK